VSSLVSAIVVAYTDADVVAKCLRSVERALAEVNGESQAILVLNRPMFDLPEACLESWIIIQPGRNLGFAGGVMTGLTQATGAWIALINDDCVVEPNAIAEMLAASASASDVGSVAAQILFADGSETINSAGIEVDVLGIAHERLLWEPAGSGGNVGGFDESFFAYLEDADLAWRAQMRGWRCIYAPRAVVRHKHSSILAHQSAQKYYLVGRNRLRMLAKNAMSSELLRRGWAMLVYDLAYSMFALAESRSLAPLRGRFSGMREWRSYRDAGHPYRSTISLARSPGFRGALRRDRAYGRATGAPFR
jgi:GT2 family glycosyltransferase